MFHYATNSAFVSFRVNCELTLILALWFFNVWADFNSRPDKVFDILVNGVIFTPNVNVYSLAQNALYKPIEITINDTNVPLVGASEQMVVNLSATATSTLGPVLNALEILSVIPMFPGTFAADGVCRLFF